MRFFRPCAATIPHPIALIISLTILWPFTVGGAAAQARCQEDKEAALVAAISYHREISLEGADAKELGGEALKRAEWCRKSDDINLCVSAFKANAQQYVSRSRHSALILYARDSDSMCAFLFKPGEEMQYARRQVREKDFDKDIEKLRAANAGVPGRSIIEARQSRLEFLREGGSCNLQSPDTEAETLDTALAASADPALEQQVAGRLFPSEFHAALEGVEHISIIPFGPITTLPVGTLRPFGDDRQAVDLFTVNYLLFAGEVWRKPMEWNGPPTKPLIFGNPIPQDSRRARCIPPLPGAEQEALIAHRLLGGTYFSQGQATRSNFELNAVNADMIYFAAHGLASTKHGITGSFIALADANLTGRDIQVMSKFEFKARLVVMSACQTGLGQINEFGVIGLARTFLDAGAENTVMSLWNVSDKATLELMSEFNRQLSRWPPAEALQIAQKHLRKSTAYKDSVFWSGFAVYGNQMTISDQ